MLGWKTCGYGEKGIVDDEVGRLCSFEYTGLCDVPDSDSNLTT